jgi:ribosome-binding factor A
MTSEARQRKMADRVKVIVAETLEKRIKDPRLGFITVTDVRVSHDIREASVFYTVYGDEESRTATAMALESAKGVIRSEVGKQTGVKFTPTLEFIPDAIPETAAHLEELLKQAAVADAAVHEQAAQATYAGESDPYRHPDDELPGDDLTDGAPDGGSVQSA